MTDNLVESIRANHKRQGFAPHVCTECRLPWPCEALVAAQRIEAALAILDATSEPISEQSLRRALTGGQE